MVPDDFTGEPIPLEMDSFGKRQTPDQIRARLVTMVQAGLISPAIARAILPENQKTPKPLTIESMLEVIGGLADAAAHQKNTKLANEAALARKAIGAMSPERKIRLEE